jgi:hypothetical protein
MQVVSNGSRTDEQSPADLRVREAAKHQKEFAAPRWGCHLGRGQRPSLRPQRSRGGVMREARALPGPPARALSDDPRLWARLRSQAGSSAARKLHPSYPEQTRSKRRGTQSPPERVTPWTRTRSLQRIADVYREGRGRYSRRQGPFGITRMWRGSMPRAPVPISCRCPSALRPRRRWNGSLSRR